MHKALRESYKFQNAKGIFLEDTRGVHQDICVTSSLRVLQSTYPPSTPVMAPPLQQRVWGVKEGDVPNAISNLRAPRCEDLGECRLSH